MTAENKLMCAWNAMKDIKAAGLLQTEKVKFANTF